MAGGVGDVAIIHSGLVKSPTGVGWGTRDERVALGDRSAMVLYRDLLGCAASDHGSCKSSRGAPRAARGRRRQGTASDGSDSMDRVAPKLPSGAFFAVAFPPSARASGCKARAQATP